MSRTPALLATRSAGKLRELRPLFERYGVAVIDLTEAGVAEHPDEEAIEAFDTFEANARAKAEYFFRRSGFPTFADDSGLAVRALGGRPGVRSKRWSGRSDLDGEALDAANNTKLMEEVRALPPGASLAAEYICAAAFADGAEPLVTVGRTSGVIVRHPAGALGFGYDPYFLSSDLGVTFGQADPVSKNAVSHRGRAFTVLLGRLRGRSHGE